MDIALLSMSMAQSTVMNQVDVAVLSKTLDTIEEMGDGMKKIMELSVNPSVGSNFDVSV